MMFIPNKNTKHQAVRARWVSSGPGGFLFSLYISVVGTLWAPQSPGPFGDCTDD